MKHTRKFLILNSYLLILFALLISCQQNYPNVLPSGSSSLNSLFQDNEALGQLDSPSQLFVSKGLYSDTIKISWSKVPNAASYKLERAVKLKSDTTPPSEEDFETISASKDNIIDSSYITKTSFTDRILDDPKYSAEEYQYVYYYRVSAENKKLGYEPSDFTDPTNTSTDGKGYLLAPPASATASAGESSDKITISWSKTDNARRYIIYRATKEDNISATKIGQVTGDKTSFTDKVDSSYQGVNFYYSVEAVNSISETSVKSAVALGYALKEGAPGRVQNVKVINGRGEDTDGIKISWDEVTGTDIKYTIYRTSSTDSAMTLLKKGEVAKEFTDRKNLKPNTYYYYKVLAYTIKDGEEIKGPISQSSDTDKDENGNTTAAEGFILSQPSDVYVEKIGSVYKINFNQPIGENGYAEDSLLYDDYKEYEYEIFGGETKENVNTPITYLLSAPDNGYYTATVPHYKFYRIVTKFEDKESASSAVVAPSPSAAQNVYVSRAKFIEGYTEPDYENNYSKLSATASEKNAFNQNGVYPVELTWEAPSDGADGGYNIYRSDKIDSGFRKVNDDPVKELCYIDKNESAKAGKIYYYKVLALNSLGQGSNYSEVDVPELENNFIKSTGRGFGWGAISHNQYMIEYNKTIQRSQSKLTIMHKPNDLDKLGSETINGDITGTLGYTASMAGLGAEIKMPYKDYADFYIDKNESLGIYFCITGNTDTKSNMSANGNMSGTVVAKGMYPGTVVYDKVEIKSGNAGGGYYTITPAGFPAVKVDFEVGNVGWDR